MGGSTGARGYDLPMGRFVGKRGDSQGHINNEYDMNRYLNELGVPVPQAQMQDGLMLTQMEEGQEMGRANQQDIQQAVFRLKFEELFYLQLELLIRKKLATNKHKGFIFNEVGELFNSFFKKYLPFELTNAQKKVVKEIRKDSTQHNGTLIKKVSSVQKTRLKLAYIESYGCQMNFADSEVVASILDRDGYQITENLQDASLVLVNTCSIR